MWFTPEHLIISDKALFFKDFSDSQLHVSEILVANTTVAFLGYYCNDIDYSQSQFSYNAYMVVMGHVISRHTLDGRVALVSLSLSRDHVSLMGTLFLDDAHECVL